MWWVPGFYLALHVVVYWWYRRQPKTFSTYELVGCWFVAMILRDDWLTIVSINLHLVELTKVLYLSITLAVCRILLFPMIEVLFLQHYALQPTFDRKLLAFLMWTLALLLLEYVNARLGLYQHTGWSYWWSVLFWTANDSLLIGIRHMFQFLAVRTREER